MANLDENPILDLGKTPIPGGEPCGADVADDEQYINVLAEVAKADRIEAEEPEWYTVEQDAINVLRTKSKDAEIAAGLGYALFKRYGYAGLSAGLGMLTEIVKNFWDGMYPNRPRRRKVLIETLADRFSDGGWFRDNPPKPNDFDALDQAVLRAEALEAALKEKLPEEPPELAKFIRGLKEHAGKRPKAAAPPAAAPQGEGQPGGQPAAGGAGFAAGEIKDASGALNAMLSACTFIRKNDPTEPTPYAVVRLIKWARASLPASDAAKTEIPPPDGPLVESLTHQFNNGLWEHLLKNAEGAFRANDPLWLDLQRYVCVAMQGLGPPYDKAREAVTGVTGMLVSRLGAGVYDLRFKSGLPLCSGETRMWLESDVLAGMGGGGQPSASSSANGKLAEAAGKAKKLAGSGKLKEALQELREGLVASTQRRDRFLWRLQIAQLCFDAKRMQLASPLLEECHDEIQRFHIDEWEPSLAVEVAQTLYRCRKAITSADKNPAQTALEGVRDSFAWLCQLDPLAALAAEPSGN